MSSGRLVIVSNRLPVSVKKVDGKLEYAPSVGGLSTALASYVESGLAKWIGWPGIASEELDDTDKAEITAKLREQNCHPIFLTQKQLDGFYNGYSNGALWPLFHHLPVGSGDTPANWRIYKEVNQLYADETMRLSRESNDIWIHDYQLLLVPGMLRTARPAQHIGFFLHIPFPGPGDLFQLTNACELLRGVLGADLIGMHTTNYATNFLDCCQHGGIGIVAPRKVVLPTRIVRVLDFPIGINYHKFAEASKSAAVSREVSRLRWKYRGKKVILTIDRLDPTKGLVERLKAYRTLLEENPTLHSKVIMVMQAMPSRTDVPEYQKLRLDVDELIADVNTTYGKKSWQPIEPIFSPLPFEQYAALYQRADVAFITPIRDGMNLVAKEYLASHPNSDGVLVLSKTAGAAEELKDAILVDPLKPRSLVNGLKKALDARPASFIKRTVKMQRHLRRHTVDKWADSFITSLQTPLPPPTHYFTRSLVGAPEKALVSDYHQARKRLLLLDYDGTLQPIMRHPEDAKPSRQTLSALQRLGSDSHNRIVVISGRDKDTLTKWLGNLPVTLVAEHGAFIKRPEWKTWHRMLSEVGGWKEAVKRLFDDYAAITPGARVEEKEHSVVWHYRGVSPFLAKKTEVLLRKELRQLTKANRLGIKQGKMVLEVHHLDISKGHALQEWLLSDEDFVMAIGDDSTDEDMFRDAPAGTYTIKVGRGLSAAHYRVPNPAAVHKLLRKL
jgi:trehalose 6-phosphate synthase/phosphatase